MIRLLHDRVLVLPDEAEQVTKGGIIIPDTVKEKPSRGKVIAVGNGKKDEEMVLKEGDIVYYGKYSGTELNHNGIDYMILRQSDVYCIV
jgi:chaperonin GroES